MPADIFAVLKTGGEFTAAHVLRLYSHLVRAGALKGGRKFMVLTDELNRIPSFPGLVVHVKKNLGPRWWGKIDALGMCPWSGMWLVDLDTTVFEWPEEPADSTFNADFYNAGRFGSGFCYFTKQDAARVWAAYKEQGPTAVQEAFSGKTTDTLGDQAFMASVLGDMPTFDQGEVCSYKKHIRAANTSRVPASVKVVCFHGRQRPWSIPELTKR